MIQVGVGIGVEYQGKAAGGGAGSPTFSQKTFASVAGFGDSMTAGAAASTDAQRFINIVAANFGASLLNAGISGTSLQNSLDKTGNPMANNGRDRTGDVLGANKKAALVIAYGVNDERYTAAPTTFNMAAFINDYREVLNICILGGYPAASLCLASPFWVSDAYMLNNPTNPDYSGQTRAGADAYAAAVKDLATEFGCFYGGVYEASFNQTTWVFTDGLHPNDLGHAGYASAILAATQRNSNSASASVSAVVSGTTITVTPAAVSGATSYDYQLLLSGVAVSSQTAVSGPNTAFSGVAAGAYRVKSRPNFSNGTSGPWTLSTADAVVGAAIFLSDTYTAPDGTALTAHAPNIGGTYSEQPGVGIGLGPLIASNTVYSTDTFGIYQNAATPPTADYTVEADITCLSVLANDTPGVAARMQPSVQTLYWAGYTTVTGNWRLFKTVAGTSTQLGSNLADTFASGTRHLVLSVSGSTISATVSGTLIASVTDTSIAAAGVAGIRLATVGGASATTGMHLDNLVATKL